MKDQLKQIREKLRKTQKEMGALVGVHERAWQKYEKGSNLPGSEVLQALSKLGFNTNWILTGAGDMRVSAAKRSNQTQIDAAGVHENTARYDTSENMPSVQNLLSIQIQPVIDAVMDVMTSDHAGVKLALTQNALMFQEMVRNAKKLDRLEKRIEEIERVDKHHEGDFKPA
jgi:transcriptional regulator with XRE-family HTH domain